MHIRPRVLATAITAVLCLACASTSDRRELRPRHGWLVKFRFQRERRSETRRG